MNPSLLLFIILLFAIISSFFSMTTYFNEGFQSFLGDSPSNYPPKNGILDGGLYPATGEKIIGDNQEQKMWWHYPIFEVGSYKQITNNIRYPNDPDDGGCMPAEFCGTFYKEAPRGELPSNYSTPLDPVAPGQGSRINYYWTPDNMQPFTTSPELFVAP